MLNSRGGKIKMEYLKSLNPAQKEAVTCDDQ